jgi:hypothetical protein
VTLKVAQGRSASYIRVRAREHTLMLLKCVKRSSLPAASVHESSQLACYSAKTERRRDCNQHAKDHSTASINSAATLRDCEHVHVFALELVASSVARHHVVGVSCRRCRRERRRTTTTTKYDDDNNNAPAASSRTPRNEAVE